MQICTATVRLGGLITNTVHMTEVTPSEIVILQSIHGKDSVTDIIPTHVVPRAQLDEWERLTKKYDEGQVATSDDVDLPRSRLEKLFPGAVKRMFTTLDEAGLSAYVDPNRLPQHSVSADDAIRFADGAADAPLSDVVGEQIAGEAADHEGQIAAVLAAEAKAAPEKVKA